MSLGKTLSLTVICLVFCNNLQAGVFPYKYATVQLTVVDDQTGEPLPKAKVSVYYSDEYYFNHPNSDAAVTDDKGTATVKIAKGTSDWNITLKPAGYLLSHIQYSEKHAIPDKLKIQCIKLPKITLVVPNGYVGPINFQMPRKPKPGSMKALQREYDFHADAQGNVRIQSLETFLDFIHLEEALQTCYLTAFYEDGKQIPTASRDGSPDEATQKNSTIALRHVVYCPPGQFFVIGTDHDRQALNDSIITAIEKSHEKQKKNINPDRTFTVHDYNWERTFVGIGQAPNEAAEMRMGTSQHAVIHRVSPSGIERIGIDFTPDIHNYEWGKTNTETPSK